MWRPRGAPDADALNHYWNAVNDGAPPEELARLAEAIDPSFIAAIDQARALHARRRPRPAFAHRLEQDLMHAFASTPSGSFPRRLDRPSRSHHAAPSQSASLPARPAWPQPGRSLLAYALVFAGVILVAAIVATFAFFPGQREPAGFQHPSLVLPAASPATPAVGAGCTAKPRHASDLVALWFNAQGTPQPHPGTHAYDTTESQLPAGKPADAATIAAATAVVREWMACSDARQTLRWYALMTDALVREYGFPFDQAAFDSPAKVAAFLESGALMPGDQQPSAPTPIWGVRGVRVLADGRVAGIWTIGGGNVLSIVLVRSGGQWLLDEVGYLPEVAIPAGATPLPA